MNVGYILGFILVVGFLFLMLRKGGCCGGMREESKKGGGGKMGDRAKDPICGMEVDRETAAAKSEHMGKTFYFCSPGCKAEFDKNPMKYMEGEKKEGGGCCH